MVHERYRPPPGLPQILHAPQRDGGGDPPKPFKPTSGEEPAADPLAPASGGASSEPAQPTSGEEPPSEPPAPASGAEPPSEPPAPASGEEPPASPPNPFASDDHRRDCDRVLHQLGVWAQAIQDSGLVFPGRSPAVQGQIEKRIKKIPTMVMLVMLAAKFPPGTDFDDPPDAACSSLNGLATALDEDRIAAMSNTLRGQLLPAAMVCGLIGGFLGKEAGEGAAKATNKQHRIHITEKGLQLVLIYFRLRDQF